MRPLPLSACHCYSPTDFDPGYKYLLISKSTSSCCPGIQQGYYPGDEYKALDNDCVRLAFRGLEVRRDCTFRLLFGWGTTESFNRAFRLLDGQLLEVTQACQQVGEVYIEFDDKYLYDVYSDLHTQPLTGGRYVLLGATLDCVNAQLEMNHRMSIIEVKGRYSCLEHHPRYREVALVKPCLGEQQAC
jgi:hypothetical protein